MKAEKRVSEAAKLEERAAKAMVAVKAMAEVAESSVGHTEVTAVVEMEVVEMGVVIPL